jgi:hypothetical protein
MNTDPRSTGFDPRSTDAFAKLRKLAYGPGLDSAPRRDAMLQLEMLESLFQCNPQLAPPDLAAKISVADHEVASLVARITKAAGLSARPGMRAAASGVSIETVLSGFTGEAEVAGLRVRRFVSKHGSLVVAVLPADDVQEVSVSGHCFARRLSWQFHLSKDEALSACCGEWNMFAQGTVVIKMRTGELIKASFGTDHH